jgi:hypothetical protein
VRQRIRKLRDQKLQPSESGAPFYRRTRIEELGEKHPGLLGYVVDCQQRRVPSPQIAAFILKNWAEVVSEQVLHNFYVLRVWPSECSQAREAKVQEKG